MVYAQLSVRVGDMTLDGGQADHQSIGDLLVPHSRCDEPQDLDFSWCKRLRQASYGKPGRDGNGLSPVGEGSPIM